MSVSVSVVVVVVVVVVVASSVGKLSNVSSCDVCTIVASSSPNHWNVGNGGGGGRRLSGVGPTNTRLFKECTT